MSLLEPLLFPLAGTQFIEASAGTGKTYTITNLYLRLLLGHETPRPLAVSEILVLTFTKAATRELKNSIRERIKEARRSLLAPEKTTDAFIQSLLELQENNDRTETILSSALQLMDEASIFTIHGFCAKVLQEQSFETGSLFDMDPGADRNQLLQQACEDFFRKDLNKLNIEEQNIAQDLWSSPADLVSIMNKLIWRPGLVIEPEPSDLSSGYDAMSSAIKNIKQLWIDDDVESLLKGAGIKGNAKTLTATRLASMNQFARTKSAEPPEWECWTTAFIRKSLKVSTTDESFLEHKIFALIDFVDEEFPRLQARTRVNLIHRALISVKESVKKSKSSQMLMTMDDLLTLLEIALVKNPELSSTLANLYPATLIDEFQDTDQTQYQIFDSIFSASKANSTTFVGDPKQAIYEFRGADVYTYINAKRQVRQENIHQLGVNWRSSQQLVDAVNNLFDKKNVFGEYSDIQYQRVTASPQAVENEFKRKDKPLSPVTFFNIETNKTDKPDARGKVVNQLCDWSAELIASLLNDSNQGDITLKGEAIEPGQISVLVRDRREAKRVKESLQKRNVQSVYLSQESIFRSETAQDIYFLLLAIVEPENDQKIRSALSTPLMQSSISEITALDQNPEAHQLLMQEFLDYHQLWAKEDFAPMMTELTRRRSLAEKWLIKAEGERRLTDLRQLIELLQQQTIVNPGMETLTSWLAKQIQEEREFDEERQLRMESERKLVSIVTIHSSKGLEYDLVFIPSACFVSKIDAKELPLYHREDKQKFITCVDLDSSSNSQTRALAQTEKLNEDMRLLYVALTRAKAKCFLGVAYFEYRGVNMRDSAFAKVINMDLSVNSSDKLGEYLEQQYESPLFDVQRLEQEPGTTRVNWNVINTDLQAPFPKSIPDKSWKIYSYTYLSHALSTDNHEHLDDYGEPAVSLAGYQDDEQGPTEFLEKDSSRFDRYTFPRGARVGVMLHDILEHLEQCRDESKLVALCEKSLNHFGLEDPRWLDVLTNWVSDIMNTPLIGNSKLSLSEITSFVPEMEFHFPVPDKLRLSLLTQQLHRFQYLKDKSFNLENISGAMTGLIDLVFESQGQYFLLDYKSNHLGDEQSSYQTKSLINAIEEHDYDLQYLIYALALHRYLRQQIRDYDYKEHFGGVIYLFLRGMNGIDQSGVYFDKPDQELVEALDAFFS